MFKKKIEGRVDSELSSELEFNYVPVNRGDY